MMFCKLGLVVCARTVCTWFDIIHGYLKAVKNNIGSNAVKDKPDSRSGGREKSNLRVVRLPIETDITEKRGEEVIALSL